MDSPSQDFEPLVRRKKSKTVSHPTPKSTPTGRHGTTITGPVYSMSTFIQSALACSSNSSGVEMKKDVSLMAASTTCSKKRGNRYGEKSSRARKKVKLGIGDWTRLADDVQWPSSSPYSDPLEGLGERDSDAIDSYSDDSVSDISVHTSPEIGKAQIIDSESFSEIDNHGTHSPLTTKSLRREGRTDSAEMKGSRWKARPIKLQTSTPLCNRTQSEDLVDIDDSESFSSNEEMEPRPFEPHPLTTTPPKSHSSKISRGIPISMATLYVEPDNPPEYMSIETPPSSPELYQSNQLYQADQFDHSDVSRTKTSEWIKHVSFESNQCDQSCLNETMKTPVDSAKKSRRKKFVLGGLAEQLQRIIQRENSDITFWEHRSAKAQQDSEQDLSGCLTVHIYSLLHCYSLLLAKASLTQGSLLDSTSAMAIEQAKNDREEVTVLFSQRCARFLCLQGGHIVRIHPPWQCLYLPSISHNVVLCTHFCQIVGHTPCPSRTTSDPSLMTSKQFDLVGISRLLTPDKIPQYSTSMLLRSPAKGLLPTRLFNESPSTTSKTAAEERGVQPSLVSAQSTSLLRCVDLARGGVVNELTAVVRRVYRRKRAISLQSQEQVTHEMDGQQLDRWCFLIEDRCGTFAEVSTTFTIAQHWCELVRCGEGKTVTFNNLRISQKTTTKRNPEVISLMASVVYNNCSKHTASQGSSNVPPSLHRPPSFCYMLRATSDSTAHIMDTSNTTAIEGELSTAPLITKHRLVTDADSALDEYRVSLLGRVVHTHSEQERDDADSAPPFPLKTGYHLFIVTQDVQFSTSDSIDSTNPKSAAQQLVRLYLKPSFSVDKLDGVLTRPGTGLLLKDVLCQKAKGSGAHDNAVFSLDACSLLLPTSIEWLKNIGACDYPYPEMRLTDEELRILGRLSQPHPPVMDRTNALPHTLLAVNGMVVGVDEENAFSWPVCDNCHTDRLAESADSPSDLYCECCGRVVDSPDVHVELSVYLKCTTLEHVRVSVKLLQSTIQKLLPISLSSIEKGFNISCVLKKCLHLNSCYLIEGREPIDDDDEAILMLEEVDISFKI